MLAQLSDASGMESWPVLGLLGRACLVALAMASVLWLWRRTHRPGSGSLLQVIEQRRLSTTHSLFVVKVGQRSLLLGASPQGLTMLGELDPPGQTLTQTIEPASTTATAPAWPPVEHQWSQSTAHGDAR